MSIVICIEHVLVLRYAHFNDNIRTMRVEEVDSNSRIFQFKEMPGNLDVLQTLRKDEHSNIHVSLEKKIRVHSNLERLTF